MSSEPFLGQFVCNFLICVLRFDSCYKHSRFIVMVLFIIRYILEGKELEFYMKKIQRKKGKSGAGAAA